MAIAPYLEMVKLPVIGIFQLIEEWNLPVRLAGSMMTTMLQGQTALQEGNVSVWFCIVKERE